MKPSLAVATGTSPPATAAALPPDEPPGVRLTFHVYLYFDATLDAVGTTSFSGNLSLPPGVHAVTVQAFDASGYVSAPSEPIYFEILQPQPPTIDSVNVATTGAVRFVIENF